MDNGSPKGLFKVYLRHCLQGGGVSFATASVSMRLRISFTRRRSSSLSEPGRFEYAFKSGAFSKRYGFEVV